MSVLWIVLALVAAQRLAELAYARRNTRRLLAEGAAESGAAHYPLLVGLHALWLLSLAIFVPADRQPDWGLLALFAVLQLLRLWVLASLGRFWTTRVITLPGAPLRSEEHTSELQSLMRISYAVFCLKKKKQKKIINSHNTTSTYNLQ